MSNKHEREDKKSEKNVRDDPLGSAKNCTQNPWKRDHRLLGESRKSHDAKFVQSSGGGLMLIR